MNDTLSGQIKREPQSIKIETPLGKIESDSGNHLIDGFTIIVLVFVFYLGKKLIDNYFKGAKG